MTEKPSATELVYASLKAALLTGSVPPGPLDIRRLGDLFRVSATPVREALARLACEEHVHFARNRGYYVRLPTADELTDLYNLSSDLLQLALTAIARSALKAPPRAISRTLVAGLERGAVRYSERLGAMACSIASSQGNAVLARAICWAGDRLQKVRPHEYRIVQGSEDDSRDLLDLWTTQRITALRERLTLHFDQRVASAQPLAWSMLEEFQQSHAATGFARQL